MSGVIVRRSGTQLPAQYSKCSAVTAKGASYQYSHTGFNGAQLDPEPNSKQRLCKTHPECWRSFRTLQEGIDVLVILERNNWHILRLGNRGLSLLNC